MPILPTYTHSERPWILNTWDRMRVPRPFSVITVYYGSPITIPSHVDGAEFEGLLTKVAEAINSLESGAVNRLPSRRPLATETVAAFETEASASLPSRT